MIVKRITVTGSKAFSAEELHAVVQDIEGRFADFNALQALAARITDFYHSRKRVNVYGILPDQDVSGGMVRIMVVKASSAKALAVKPQLTRARFERTATVTPAPRPQARPALPAAVPAEQPAAPAPQAAKVFVKSFRFGGDLVVPIERLQALLADQIGRELDFAALRQAAERVTQYLRGEGYILARAYLPPQEIRDGSVEVLIRAGKAEGSVDGGGIALKAPPGLRLKPERVRKTVAAALSGGEKSDSLFLKMDRLEHGLLLLNDLPGIATRSTLDKGSEPGSSKVIVAVSEPPLLSGSVWADNYGNRYTGDIRRNALISLNDPDGIGDQGNLSAVSADGLLLGRLDYSFPIGYRGLRLDASYSELTYRIGRELAPLDAKGDARTAGIDLRYPLVRSRAGSLFAGIGYDRRALKDESAGAVTSDRRIDAWSATVNGSDTDKAGGGMTAYSLILTQGQLDLSRTADVLAADHATWKTNSTYSKADYSLTRLQRLDGKWTFLGMLNGQVASRNLGSSEQFILGGPSGVRAYPSGEATGDAGWVANLELHYDLPDAGVLGSCQMIGFLDSGRITLHHDTDGNAAWIPGADNSYQLSGAGLGINFGKVGLYSVRAAYAWKLGSNPGLSAEGLDSDGRRDGSRFWLQAEAEF